MPRASFENPFRPGAGHRPPHLAGRRVEIAEFERLLKQRVITDNFVLTGLRGVGKTVLLDEMKPIAITAGWMWVGTDLSESASITEANLAQRLITDLAVATGSIVVDTQQRLTIGFGSIPESEEVTLGYDTLMTIFERAPGLIVDRLKAVLLAVSPFIRMSGKSGIIFAYDEAQNLSDHAARDQFPLSLLLDLFQSVQRQEHPFLLILTGLPTLFPKLVDARTYSERMFRVVFLNQLSEQESREAINVPVHSANCPVKFSVRAISLIYEYSGGYPYFIQFICREAYDSYLLKLSQGREPTVPITEIVRKLDTDFFAGRWARATDRQQQLLYVIANLDASEGEFTVQEVAQKSSEILEKPFGRSHVNQLLSSMISAGLVYRDRHGKYQFAVPLMAQFVRRSMDRGFV